MKAFNPEIWGPHYWFVLMTMAHVYPDHPNDVTKKVYYQFLQNLPLFIPNPESANVVEQLLSIHPPNVYLTNKNSLIYWVYLMHNEVNKKLEKREMSLHDALHEYYGCYMKAEWFSLRSVLYLTCFMLLLCLIFYMSTL